MKKIEITETRFYDKTTRGEVFEANDHTATIKSRKSATDEAVPVSLDWIAIGEW